VGEQGWELYFSFEDGLALWDAFFEAGVLPIGIETYANSRRLEKSLRLQNADLETDYNLYEADLARKVVKKTDFHGKQAYLAQRDLHQQAAYLCTMVMLDDTDAEGVRRFPVGEWPIMSADSGEVLVDRLGRRSTTTSIVYGPSLAKNLILGYIPAELAKEGTELVMEYFTEQYPIRIEAVGYKPLLDPENHRPRS
jgi:glycine cleavage system aminomethyltransferase T